jgi:hypothetical protein
LLQYLSETNWLEGRIADDVIGQNIDRRLFIFLQNFSPDVVRNTQGSCCEMSGPKSDVSTMSADVHQMSTFVLNDDVNAGLDRYRQNEVLKVNNYVSNNVYVLGEGKNKY